MSGNLTSVGLTNGVPATGTGTVSTLDALMADGGQATLGFQADAAQTNPGLAASVVALLKGVIATLQGFFALNAGANAVASQASVTTAASPVVAARAGRGRVHIRQLSTTPVWLGPAGVTPATGYPLLGVAGDEVRWPTSAAIYGVTETGSATVGVVEIF